MKPIAIKENHLYKKAYLGGKKASGRYTVIYVLKDKKAYKLKKANPRKEYINRIGIAVSKKIGGAVQRNRAKRVIRAAFAQIEKQFCLKKGYLIVISAREAATEAKSQDIFAEMKRQMEKIELVSVTTDSESAPADSDIVRFRESQNAENISSLIEPVSENSGEKL